MTRGILGGHQQDVKMKPSEILKETYPAHIQVSHYIFGLLLEELDKRFMLNKHSVFSFCRVLQRCVPPLSVMLCFSSRLLKDPSPPNTQSPLIGQLINA